MRAGSSRIAGIRQRVAIDDEEVGALADLDRAELVAETERLGGAPGRRPDRRGGAEPALGQPDQLGRARAGRAAVVAHRERDARRPGPPTSVALRVVRLALRLLDEARRELVGEPLGEVVEGRQGRDEDDAALGHPVEELGGAVERQAVLDGVDALLDRDPGAAEALRVGRHPEPHPVRLVDDGGDLLAGHLGRLRVLALHRAGAGGHDLDEVGAVADLLADGLAHLPRPVGLAVHRPEDAGRRARSRSGSGRTTGSAGPSTSPSSMARRRTIASPS